MPFSRPPLCTSLRGVVVGNQFSHLHSIHERQVVRAATRTLRIVNVWIDLDSRVTTLTAVDVFSFAG